MCRKTFFKAQAIIFIIKLGKMVRPEDEDDKTNKKAVFFAKFSSFIHFKKLSAKMFLILKLAIFQIRFSNVVPAVLAYSNGIQFMKYFEGHLIFMDLNCYFLFV